MKSWSISGVIKITENGWNFWRISVSEEEFKNGMERMKLIGTKMKTDRRPSLVKLIIKWLCDCLTVFLIFFLMLTAGKTVWHKLHVITTYVHCTSIVHPSAFAALANLRGINHLIIIVHECALIKAHCFGFINCKHFNCAFVYFQY